MSSHRDFCECMAQSVKQNLRRTLTNAQLNYEEPIMVLVEVKTIINSTPLTYLYSDNINEVLSPNDFVLYLEKDC